MNFSTLSELSLNGRKIALLVDVKTGKILYQLANGSIFLFSDGTQKKFAKHKFKGGFSAWDTILSSYPFGHDDTLVEVVKLDQDVTWLRDYAFYGCSSLSSVNLSDSIASIGSSAFENCSSLISVDFEDSVRFLYSRAFANCVSLSSVDLGNSLKKIPSECFMGCKNLENIEVSQNISSFGERCFAESGLRTIQTKHPFGCELKEGTFQDCNELTSVNIKTNGLNYQLPKNCFRNCISLTSLFDLSGVVNNQGAYNTTTYFNWGDNAFRGCSSLEQLIIPRWAVSYADKQSGKQIFSDCTNAQYAKIEDYVNRNDYEFLEGLFENDVNLKHVEFNTHGTSNYSMAAKKWFKNCKSLLSLDFEDCKYGRYLDETFNGCSSLAKAPMPIEPWMFCNGAFKDCISLSSIDIPKSLRSLSCGEEGGVFNGCVNLTCFNLSSHEFVPEIDDSLETFRNCGSKSESNWYTVWVHDAALLNEFKENQQWNLIKEHLSAVIDWHSIFLLTDGTLTGHNAGYYGADFKYDGNLETLAEVQTLERSLTAFDSYAFQDCVNLSAINVPNSIETIRRYAFRRCESLTSLNLTNVDRVVNLVVQNAFDETGSKYGWYEVRVEDDLYFDYLAHQEWSKISAHLSTETQPIVTFVNWDGSELKRQTVNYKQTAEPPQNPTKEGHLFTGWSSEAWMHPTMDVTITAVYAAPLMITFNSSIDAEWK